MTERLENLLYGDRVEFDWTDALGKTIRVQGLYSKPCPEAPDKCVVTITSRIDGIYNTQVIIDPVNLTIVEHPKLEGVFEIKEGGAISVGSSGDPGCTYTEVVSQESAQDRSIVESHFDRLTLIAMRDNIMDNFDFEKVHRAMVALDWKWAGNWNNIDEIDDSMHVPELSEIRSSARHQMDRAIDYYYKEGTGLTTGTGGFEVGLHIDEETGNPYLSLKFILTDWEESYDEVDEYREDYLRRLEDGGPILR